MFGFWSVVLGLLMGLIALPAIAAAQNPIFMQLLDRGVTMEGTQPIHLSKPTLPDGLTAEAQRQALSQITDDNHPLDALTRKTVVAPFVLRITALPAVATARPRRVDLWFVAYGDFERLKDEDFLKQQVESETSSKQGGSKGEGRTLSEEALQSRQIMPESDRRYLAAKFTLFDRVRISGVMQAMLTHSPESIILAAALDPRFAKDAEFPNAWRQIRRDEAGRLSIGDTFPYTGAAWYCKATKLQKPAGSVLVEYHLIFDEPQGWFNGANLLRSKLPILVQDGVRKFRRRFADEVSQTRKAVESD